MYPTACWESEDRYDDNVLLVRPEDLSVKTFSAGTAAQHVLGKGLNSSLGLTTIENPEDKEIIERRLDCRKKLIIMKSGNAESEAESGGRTVIQQEDLQEWLDNLQLKLRQACNVPANPAGSGSRPTRPQRPSGGGIGMVNSQSRSLSLPLSSSVPSLSSRPARKYKIASGPASQPIIRPRSINGLADQAAAALTDGQYIERLQVSLQQASVSSLHDRLAERKLHSSQLPASTSSGAVRPKTVKSPSKIRHPSPVKAHSKKHPSDKTSKPSSLPASSPVQPPTVKSLKNKGATKKGGRHRVDDGSSDGQISNSTSSLHLGNLISRKQRSSDKTGESCSTEAEKPVRGRTSFVASDIFDCGQTVDDIYQAAEHLLLPPARRDVNQTDQSTVQYESQLMNRQASDEEEIPEVEDFWGAVPEY